MQLVSKMFALSYGIASLSVHQANPQDHLGTTSLAPPSSIQASSVLLCSPSLISPRTQNPPPCAPHAPSHPLSQVTCSALCVPPCSAPLHPHCGKGQSHRMRTAEWEPQQPHKRRQQRAAECAASLLHQGVCPVCRGHPSGWVGW